MSLPRLGVRMPLQVRARAGPWLALALALVLLVCAHVVAVGGVPFASTSASWRLRSSSSYVGANGQSGFVCTLDASGLGISSIGAGDIQAIASEPSLSCSFPPGVDSMKRPYPALVVPWNQLDLSRNELAALPVDLLANLTAQMSPPLVTPQGSFSNRPYSFDFSRNAFNAAAIANFFTPAGSSAPSVFGARVNYGFRGASLKLDSVDLSYNPLEAVPAALQNLDLRDTALVLAGTGITAIPANAFSGTSLASLDLSLNDLSGALVPDSFTGLMSRSLTLRNCKLRGDSLPRGVFDPLMRSKVEFDTLHLANYADKPTTPSIALDPRPLYTERLNPPGQAYAYNLPTEQQYVASWPNYFDPFPSDVLGGVPQQLVLGDVSSFPSPLFNLTSLTSSRVRLEVYLAPLVAARAMGMQAAAAATHCPLHSLLRAFTTPSSQLLAAPTFTGIRVHAYDLPTPAASQCTILDCRVIEGGCQPVHTTSYSPAVLSTEPVTLQRSLLRWMRQLGLVTSLAYKPPTMGLWHPALNRSDWAPNDLLCDVNVRGWNTLPALPYSEFDPLAASMPFPPPSGMLACLLSGSPELSAIDWTSARMFTSGLLAVAGGVSKTLGVWLDMEALYAGRLPVPPGFFDSLASAQVTVSDLALMPDKNSYSTPGSRCGRSCARIASECPRIVEQQCQPCPDGYAAKSKDGYWYCSAAPAGSFANHSISSNFELCKPGSWQSKTAQASCIACPRGTYGVLPGRVDPASCLQCPSGTANPRPGGDSLDACVPCAAGSASGVPGVAGCPLCGPGQWQSESGGTSCVLCAEGKYQPLLGANSSSACVDCPPSAPKSAAGSVSLLQCTAPICGGGNYTASLSAAPCSSRCPLGSYCQLGAVTPCPAATFNDQLGGSSAEACKPCPAGTANAYPGAISCMPCAPGYYQPDIGALQCLACGRNTYQPLARATAASQCLECPKATPLSPPASGSVFQCSSGIVCEAGEMTSDASAPCAANCPRGRFCRGGVATPCAAGSYADREGMATCTPCGAGRYSAVVGSSSATECQQCPASSWSAAPLASSCMPCEAGTLSAVTGATSNSTCVRPAGNCATPAELSSSGSQSGGAAGASLCLRGVARAIDTSQLLPGGLAHFQAFLQMQQSEVLAQPQSQPQPQPQPDEAASRSQSAPAMQPLQGAPTSHAAYAPLRRAPSLRMAAFGSDATLSSLDATGAAASGTSAQSPVDLTQSSLSAAAAISVVIVLVLLAFVPWLLYRFVPERVVLLADQFALKHALGPGESPAVQPTQFGAVMSWSFVCIALLVAILLGTESNTQRVTELVPPSATPFSGTARANIQLTVRAYTGEDSATLATWCRSDNAALLEAQRAAAFSLRAQPTGPSCSLALDCSECALAALTTVTLSLPHNAQLLEWEVFVNSAQPGAWARRYGVLTQQPGQLLDAASELRFSAMEAYYIDARSGAFEPEKSAASVEAADRSGYELNFVQYATLTPQPIDTYSAATRVQLSFVLQKSDVVLHTTLTNKQTMLQILALIASTVATLFGVFGIAFQLLERHALRRCGLSAGAVGVQPGSSGAGGPSSKSPRAPGVAGPSDASEVELHSVHASSPSHSARDALPPYPATGAILAAGAVPSEEERGL